AWYLATSDERLPFHEYEELVEAVGDQYALTLIEGTDAEWLQFLFAHNKEDWPIGDLKWIRVRTWSDFISTKPKPLDRAGFRLTRIVPTKVGICVIEGAKGAKDII